MNIEYGDPQIATTRFVIGEERAATMTDDAYVDLDGVAAFPISKKGAAKKRAMDGFRSLIERSRGQRLVSGLVTLVNELAKAIQERLGVADDHFYNYVLNQHELWSDQRLSASAPEETDDVNERTLLDFVEELDVALFSIVEDLDTPVEALAESLDAALGGSLWTRTLARKGPEERKLLREVLVSRARRLWRNTSAEQRQGCFFLGLGYRAGLFIHDNLEGLLSKLIAIEGASLREDPDEVSDCVLALAEILEPATLFRARTRPANWRDVLSAWVKGVAFKDMLASCEGGDSTKALQFIQETVIFEMVWAAEAARVQAVARELENSDMASDGPALALTYGVPSRRAAVLCQAGFASRIGAVWACQAVPHEFHDADGQRRWFRKASQGAGQGNKLDLQRPMANVDAMDTIGAGPWGASMV